MKNSTFRLIVTSKCNQNCIFCDFKDGYGKENLNSLCNSNLLLASKDVVITGGEPTLYKDLPLLIKKLKKINKKVTLITNGISFSSKNYVKKIENTKIDEIVFSFVEFREKEYDILTNTKDFHKKLKGLKNLASLNNKIKIFINFLIYSGNQNLVTEYIKKIYKEYKIKNFILSVLEPDCNRVRKNKWLIPDMKTVLNSLIKLKNFVKNTEIFIMLPQNGVLPFCIAKKLNFFYPISDNIINTTIESNNYIKFEFCKRCSYNRKCNGIIKTYSHDIYNFIRNKICI